MITLPAGFRFTIASQGGRIKGNSGKFLWIVLLLCVLGCQPQAISPNMPVSSDAPHVTIVGKTTYSVRQSLTLVNDGPGKPEKQNIWVALIRDFPPYQQILSMKVSPGTYQRVVDEYGNQYAEFDFSRQAAGTTRTVTIDYQVTVNELIYDLANCQGSLPNEFTAPELWIESLNPQIVTLAKRLSQGKKSICQQVQAFYNYVGDTLIYTYNGRNWGAQAALGPKMGSDCTEYSDLLVALSRAQSIPARYFEGLLYLDASTTALAQQEHAWMDVYLPDTGWVALDPTLGRIPSNRDSYFAHYTADHIIITLGTSPSVLRGSNYWTYLYWPGNSTSIRASGEWLIEPASGE